MPRISVFYGIVIAMYFNDHDPPHFHALYGEDEGKFLIPSIDLLAGSLAPRASKLVADWASLHADALLLNWEKARNGLPLDRIEPLP